MKTFYRIVAPVSILVFAIACNKEIDNTDITSESNTQVVEFTTAPVTKTTFGDLSGTSYPTLWTTNKNVAVSLNYGTAKESTPPVLGSGGATANFSAALSDDESETYKIAAISPFTAIVSTASFNGTYKDVKFKIETDQTPLTNSVDEDDQVLAGFYDAGTSFPSSVTMNFSHVTAYGLLSFANLELAAGETIASVSLTSSLNIAGQFYYYFEDYSSNSAGDIVATSGENTINITTTSSSNIWFACAPVEIGGTNMDVVITTDKGTTYSKTITFPAGKKFQSGKVAKFTVDMDGITADGAKVYTLVTDPASLTLDSEVIIVTNSGNYAAGALGTYTYAAAKTITKTGSNINTPSASVEVFKIANGNIAGTYALKCTSDSDKYLAITSGTSMEKANSLTNKGSWAIYITGAGLATIRNMSDTDRYILSNTSSSNRFSTYKPGSGYNDVSIYKDASTGSGAITSKSPESIAISGATTAYAIGDTYEFDGTVTLTYSDLSTKILTSSEFTVNSTAVNMSAAGSYDVEISYNADPSITAEYTIVVSSGAPVPTYLWTLTEGDLGTTGSPTSPVVKGTLSTTSSAISWTAAYSWGGDSATKYFGWDSSNSRGVQIGTGNATNKCTSMSLTTTGFTAAVTKIIIGANTASSGNASLSVSINGTPFKCNGNDSVSLNTTTTPTTYTFVGSATGTIVISITNSANKALYLKSISINND